MKNNFLKLIVVATMIASATISCKKKDDVTPDDTNEQSATAADDALFTGSMNEAFDDANSVLSGSSLGGARMAGPAAVSICGATIDSSQKAQGTVVLTFDGTTACVNGTRTRSGVITLQMPAGTKWADVGAKLTVTFTNYKVTRVSDAKYIVLNGTYSITNVTGGLIRNMANGATMIHKLRANLGLTFDDGNTRTWQLARKRSVGLNSSVYTITVEGDTSVAGNAKVANWGTNRFGNTFYGMISTPAVFSSACEYHGMSGVIVLKGATRELTLTLGVDQNGIPVTSGCPYGYKVNWTNVRGDGRTLIAEYK